MKLRQLDYLLAVVENDLNVTAAARKTHTSQPGVSRQLRLLEEELGFRIFNREGRALTRVTPAGSQVVERAQRVLREIKSIRRLSDDLANEDSGSLSIGTTHTQARYLLPDVVRDFRARYPNVLLHIHQGTSEQIAQMMAADRIDFALASGSTALFRELTILPCYRWHRTVVVTRDHPLAASVRPSMEELARHPLITYNFSFSGPSSLHKAFEARGLAADVVLTARDADVIKTYVRLGLGAGIVASVALDPQADADLVAIDATHLFAQITTWIGFRHSALLRRYMYDFMQRFAPHLDRRRVDAARDAGSEQQIERLFADIDIPLR